MSGPTPTPTQDSTPMGKLTETFSENFQADVEVTYTKVANDVIYGSLNSLDQALNATRNTLDILNGLQVLHNQIGVQSKDKFSFDYAGMSSSSSQAYIQAASGYFGTGVVPFFPPTGLDVGQFNTDLDNFKTRLTQQISTLQTLNPNAANDPNSLLSTAQKVLDDLNNNSGKDWVLDNYDSIDSAESSDAGAFQQHLNFAITAAQSLSSTQQQQVRNYLFIFQEFYQSASAMISAINGIITKMAQKIA